MAAAPSTAPTRDPRRSEIAPEPQGNAERVLVAVFTGVPFLALFAAVPLAWGRFLGWTDVVLVAIFYVLSAGGVTVGYHRHFTHGSFKARRPLRIALALAGSIAIQGPVITWVADHRRHHKHADKEMDPHSPWRFGGDWKALTKGLVWAHYGWLFDGAQTSKERFAKDLLNDRDIRRIHLAFPGLVAVWRRSTSSSRRRSTPVRTTSKPPVSTVSSHRRREPRSVTDRPVVPAPH